MARIRTIKPEFWKHEGLSALPEAAHMLAAALLNYADDEGYFNANPALIKAECFPLRELSRSVPESLQDLSKEGYVKLGTAPNGRRYGWVVHFCEHQTINKPKASQIKPLGIVWDEDGTSTGQIPDEYREEQGTGNREQGKEQGTGNGSAPPTRRAPRTTDGNGSAKEAKTTLVWNAYATAYHDRYHTEPVRNAKVNAQLSQLVDRLGEEAPAVAAFFVRHNAEFYVKRGHAVGVLLADAEKLRTEWATNRQITSASARQVDATQTNRATHDGALDILRKKGITA